jgi:insulysin
MLSAKGIETDSVEKWYGTKYKVEEIPSDLKELMKRPAGRTKKFGLPPQNILIPKNVDIKPDVKEYSEMPKKLCYWLDSDVWYKQDAKFDRPKSIVSLKVYTPDCNLGKTIEAKVFSEVWTEVMVEYLQEFLYMGTTANLTFMAKPFADNITFTWNGFDDSIPTFVSETLTRMEKMKSEKLESYFD